MSSKKSGEGAQPLKILIIEDNDKHLADAKAEVKRRVDAGENIKVDFVRNLSQYWDRLKSSTYDGIVSDIFFPSSENPHDNLANNLAWDTLGRKYCEVHREDYRCGDKRREEMFKLVQDGWMDGKELPPTGVVIAEETAKSGTPIVLCTDTYHHGIKTQPVFEYAGKKGLIVVDSPNAKEGHSTKKDWGRALDVVLSKVHRKSKSTPDITSRLSSFIAIAGVLGGIFFLSTNITGNAIADMTTKTTSFLGAGLLIVGLVAGFFWLKGRKK
jgi:hypothetical protein